MKNKLRRLWLCIFMASATVLQAQEEIVVKTIPCTKKPINDTLAYLKKFEANKVNYIRKPFSILLNDMTQIKPKTNWSITGRKNVNKTGFIFCEMDESFSNAIILNIEWQTSIQTSQVDYFENKNGFFFTNDECNFYGSKIVKNIRVYR